MPGVWQISRDAPSPACDPGRISDRTAYLAAEGYVAELAHELGAVEHRHGRLLIAAGSPRPAAWAVNVWLARLPRIEHRLESAFALDPLTVGPVDWVFSDVVCYPAQLLTLVERWLAAGTCRRFVCTIKFQGATDHQTARRFAAIPGSQLRHLLHNKHELTWSKIG